MLKTTKILKLLYKIFVKEIAKEYFKIMRNLSRNFKNQKGFNLVELMIVIAVIALLVAVAIPGYQFVIRTVNETSTAKAMDTIRTLQTGYASKHQGKFAPSFAELITSTDLDTKFQGDSPVVNGYVYRMTVQEPSGSKPGFYSLNADPQVAEGIQATGKRHFYVDSSISGTKSTEENRPSKADDPSI